MEKEKVLEGLRRVRAQICKTRRFEDEVEQCHCVLGAHDVCRARGAETGCKEIKSAIDYLEGIEDSHGAT